MAIFPKSLLEQFDSSVFTDIATKLGNQLQARSDALSFVEDNDPVTVANRAMPFVVPAENVYEQGDSAHTGYSDVGGTLQAPKTGYTDLMPPETPVLDTTSLIAPIQDAPRPDPIPVASAPAASSSYTADTSALPSAVIDVTKGRDSVLQQLAPMLHGIESQGGPSARNMAALILAENGGGQSELAAKNNNWFSISYVEGRKHQHGAGTGGRFANYDSPIDSAADFVDLISTSDRYKEAWSLRNAPVEQFMGALSNAGYIKPELGFPVDTWLRNTSTGAETYDSVVGTIEPRVEDRATRYQVDPQANDQASKYDVKFGFNESYGDAQFNKDLPNHRGVDLVIKGAPDNGRGQDVGAFQSGKIVAVTQDPNGGSGVIQQTADGLYHRYFHFDSINVKQGQEVSQGESLGKLGASGTEGFPHVHFEVSKNLNGDPQGELIDPTPYMAGVNDAPGAPIAMASGDEQPSSSGTQKARTLWDSVDEVKTKVKDAAGDYWKQGIDTADSLETGGNQIARMAKSGLAAGRAAGEILVDPETGVFGQGHKDERQAMINQGDVLGTAGNILGEAGRLAFTLPSEALLAAFKESSPEIAGYRPLNFTTADPNQAFGPAEIAANLSVPGTAVENLAAKGAAKVAAGAVGQFSAKALKLLGEEEIDLIGMALDKARQVGNALGPKVEEFFRGGLPKAVNAAYDPANREVLDQGNLGDIGIHAVSGDEFFEAADRASQIEKQTPTGPRTVGETLYVYDRSDYAKFRTFLSEDKLTGFAIKPDNDLVSVFNVGKSGRGNQAVARGVEEGALKLDAFDESGRLPEFYAKYGFEEYKRDPWNDDYAPPNWRGGTPDVVYMRRKLDTMSPKTAVETFGGATIDPRTGKHYDDKLGGYAVPNTNGLDTVIIKAKGDKITSPGYKGMSIDDAAQKFIRDNPSEFEQDGSYLGLWKQDNEDGTASWHFDVNTIHETRPEADWQLLHNRAQLPTKGRKTTLQIHDFNAHQDEPVNRGLRSASDASQRVNENKPIYTNHRGEQFNADSALEWGQYKQYERQMALGEIQDWGRAGPEYIMPYQQADTTGKGTKTHYFTPDTWYRDNNGNLFLNELKSDQFRGFQTNIAKEEMLDYTHAGDTVKVDPDRFHFPDNKRPEGDIYIKFTNERGLVKSESEGVGAFKEYNQLDADDFATDFGHMFSAKDLNKKLVNFQALGNDQYPKLAKKFPNTEALQTRLNELADMALDVEKNGYTDSKGRFYKPYQNSNKLAGIKGDILTLTEFGRERGLLPKVDAVMPHVLNNLSRSPETGGFNLGAGQTSWSVAGAGAGLEQDDEGNVSLDARKAALGILATQIPSLRNSKAFRALSSAPPATLANKPKNVTPGAWAKALVYNSLLSGPRTLMVNALGVIDVGYKGLRDSLTQHPETTYFEGLALLKSIDGAAAGAIEVLRHGATDAQAATTGGVTHLPGKLGALVESPMRATGAVDEFIHQLVYGMEQGRQAAERARDLIPTTRQGASGLVTTHAMRSQADRARVFDHLMANPTAVMSEQSLREADFATYRNKLGKKSEALGKFVGDLGWVGFAVMPFYKVIANISARGIDRSAIGLAATGFDAALGRSTKLNPDMNVRVKDGVVGAGLGLAAFSLATQSDITGAGPQDPVKRRQLERDGWAPYSVRVGGKYYSYAQAGSWALPLAASAALAETGMYPEQGKKPDEKSLGDKAVEVTRRFSELWTEQGYASTPVDFFKAISDGNGQQVQRLLAGQIGMRVPFGAGLNTIAQSQDPLMRAPEGIPELLQNRLPETPGSFTPSRKDLPPSLDIYGQERANPQFGSGALSPFRSPVIEKADRVDRELVKLGASVSMAPDTIGESKLTREQKQSYQLMSGQNIHAALDTLIDEPDYKRANDERKRSLITAATSDARTRASKLVLATGDRTFKDMGLPPKYEGVETLAQEKAIDEAISNVNKFQADEKRGKDSPEPSDSDWNLYDEYNRNYTDDYREEVKSRADFGKDRRSTKLPFDAR